MNKRIVIEFVVGKIIDLKKHGIDLTKEKIKRIWTLYDEEMVLKNAPFNPFTGREVTKVEDAVLTHHHGVFLEDAVHDWRIIGDHQLKYYSRIVSEGTKNKIILELTDK